MARLFIVSNTRRYHCHFFNTLFFKNKNYVDFFPLVMKNLIHLLRGFIYLAKSIFGSKMFLVRINKSILF